MYKNLGHVIGDHSMDHMMHNYATAGKYGFYQDGPNDASYFGDINIIEGIEVYKHWACFTL